MRTVARSAGRSEQPSVPLWVFQPKLPRDPPTPSHLISIPETLSSIKEIPKSWKLCQDLGQTVYRLHLSLFVLCFP